MTDAKSVRTVIVSGLSGSGKSNVVKFFEDLGYFCVDNLPPPLLSNLMDLCSKSEGGIRRLALGIDIRERDFLDDFLNEFNRFRKEGYEIELLFLETRDDIVQRRFSETRRPHPLSKWGSVIDGVRLEREKLLPLKRCADKILDTSDYHVHQLKEIITRIYFENGQGTDLNVSLVSFGFKYGIPQDLDLLFDVRFLRNPNFEQELKHLTGEDPRIQSYIMDSVETKSFLEKLSGFLDFLLPRYAKEGKHYLMIGIGCTGGKHRSVTIANILEGDIKAKGFRVRCRHRDIEQAN